jgi:N-acetylated-alpha-linked acidic dipeptidase
MTAVVRTMAALLVPTAALVLAAWRQPQSAPLGFARDSAAQYLRIERQFLASPSADRIDAALRVLADQPHVAGSPRDRELAEWTRDRFVEYGLDDVEIATHEVLLPWPEEVSVEMTAPRRWRASMREDPVPGDRYTQIDPALAGIPYHAYSASGEVTAPVVYAGSGNPADYDALARRGIDVRGKIALVRYSVPYSYRGFKALTAERRGLAGILIYSDPADDGFAKGKVYPDGPWGPESHIQRGGIVYDFMVPGDPLTPGWASVPGARRIEKPEAVSLPKIVSAPLSYKDARVILEHIGGPEAPAAWRGALPLTYRLGGRNAVVRLRVRADDRIRPIWTVTGRIRGRERPDETVIVGNHRDAWIYGGVDPSSGSAALMELARTLGALARSGWRPRRSILFASWDAEEFTLTSSTEWGEQHADDLRRLAVAYLNVDSAASGPSFSAAAVPALNALIADAAQTVRDPATRASIAAAVRDRRTRERGALPTGTGDDLVNNRLGSGSDYTVFLNFLGVPIADLTFDGPYGVYHSIYDNYNWVAKIGDPGFRYHVAMVRLWGVMALRLAEADVIPLDYAPYGPRIDEFARELAPRWRDAFGSADAAPLDGVIDAAAAFREAAAAFGKERDQALARQDRPAIDALNARLLQVERDFLQADGIPGRPWYRHLIYAPKFTYAPEVLPGVAEAVSDRDAGRAAEQTVRLATAIRRAAQRLSGSSERAAERQAARCAGAPGGPCGHVE